MHGRTRASPLSSDTPAFPAQQECLEKNNANAYYSHPFIPLAGGIARFLFDLGLCADTCFIHHERRAPSICPDKEKTMSPLVHKGLQKILFLASLLIVSAAAHANAKVEAVLKNYADIVHANYEDSLRTAQALQKSVDALIAAPSAANLDKARKAWIAAREPYGQSEVFRFYGGPIDDDKDIEGRLNAWPLDEAYIDYVEGKPEAGIINDRKQELSIERLIDLNAQGGEA